MRQGIFWGVVSSCLVVAGFGCSLGESSTVQLPTSTQPVTNIMQQEVLGVRVAYDAFFEKKPVTYHEHISTTTGATVIDFSYPGEDGQPIFSGQTLEVFEKPAEQSINQMVAGLVKRFGKNPNDCTVTMISRWDPLDPVVASTTEMYVVSLARKVEFTAKERAAIAARQKDYKLERDGFMDADYLKRQFTEDRAVELCTPYAYNPEKVTGSKSTRGVFYYNPAQPKRVVFAAPLYDPRLYQQIEFLP